MSDDGQMLDGTSAEIVEDAFNLGSARRRLELDNRAKPLWL